MSGFEVIGVVLGVWPVVVNALSLYRATKDGRGYGLLLNELKTEETVYREFVQQLLQADVPESDLVQLTARKRPNTGLWKDRSLHFSLERRLGKDKSNLVLETLVEMDQLLTSLSMKLINTADKGKLRASISQMKHTFPTSTFRQELDSLKQLNHRLQRLVTNGATSSVSNQDRQRTAQPSLSPDTLKENTAHAKDLYHAICKSYNCQCQSPHEANLGWRQVPPKLLDGCEPFELIFPVDEDNLHERHASIDSNASILSNPTTITDESDSVLTPTWSDPRSIGSTSPTSRNPLGRSSRSISFSKSDTGSESATRIEDLCVFVKTLDDHTPTHPQTSCLGIFGVKEKEYTVKITSVGADVSHDRSVICLDDRLVPHRDWELSRQKRMDLALSLSLAILQFYSTPWIDMWWTWKDFCMLKEDNKQVFVTGKFYSTQRPSTPSAQNLAHPASASMFWKVYGEPILTRLGFALIELALGKRLSQLRPQDIGTSGDGDMVDTYTAKRLLDDDIIKEEAGQDYHDAVQACLSHRVMMDSGPRALDSTHPNFQQDLERFVVGPLRSFHVGTWRKIFEEGQDDEF